MAQSLVEVEESADQILLNGGPNIFSSSSSTSSTSKLDNFIDESNYIPVPQFYSGRSVFITGGTGFMGKVSIEVLI